MSNSAFKKEIQKMLLFVKRTSLSKYAKTGKLLVKGTDLVIRNKEEHAYDISIQAFKEGINSKLNRPLTDAELKKVQKEVRRFFKKKRLFELDSEDKNLIRVKDAKNSYDKFRKALQEFKNTYRVKVAKKDGGTVNLVQRVYLGYDKFLSDDEEQDYLSKSRLNVNKATPTQMQQDFLHFGHVAGPAVLQVREAANIGERVYKYAQESGTKAEKKWAETFLEVTRSYYKKVQEKDAKYHFRRSTNSTDFLKGEIAIGIPELGKSNVEEGIIAGAIKTSVYKYLKDNQGQIFEMAGSPSIMELIMQQIEDLFLEKRLRNRKYLTSVTGKVKQEASKTRVLRIKGVKQKPTKRATSAESFLGNLTSLKNIINANLHDKLRDEIMGRGGAQELLNYRTGRFAYSAQVVHLGLAPSGGHLLADITWQHEPYDVFLPGHRLYRPLRDPNLLIGRAVRAILRDVGLQKISKGTRTRTR